MAGAEGIPTATDPYPQEESLKEPLFSGGGQLKPARPYAEIVLEITT